MRMASDSEDSIEMEGRSRVEEETKTAMLHDFLRKIKENDPSCYRQTLRAVGGEFDYIDYMPDAKWEELGRDIANNTHLEHLHLCNNVLNDHKISFFFQGLTRSSSIREMHLYRNELSVAAVQSMVPILQNSNHLKHVALNNNNIKSEGFNVLLRALSKSTIQSLNCISCHIESIEIDVELIPPNLTQLHLSDNNINSDGCFEVAKLLQRGSTKLKHLYLDRNMIDDEGVEILVDSLKNNTSLRTLSLLGNSGITVHGKKSFLRLVNDISSIKATMQSNHTLTELKIEDDSGVLICVYQALINNAVRINYGHYDVAVVGREKIIRTQLKSATRKQLADWLGVTPSLYSVINPLHLPEVLRAVRRCYGLGEFYKALKSSIAILISTVNKKRCLEQRRARHEARIAKLMAMAAPLRNEVERINAEIAAMEEADGSDIGTESRSSKRRRA